MASELGRALMDKALTERGIDHTLTLERENWNWVELERVAEDLVFQVTMTDPYIGILYDPDVDGLFSGYIMEDYLKRMGLDSKVKRHMNKDKVHGMGEEAVNWVIEEDIKLLIIVDAGSGDATLLQSMVEDTSNKLEKVYILDHHDYEHTEEPTPDVSLINVVDRPDLPPVSGCGVVYKTLEATKDITELNTDRYEKFVGITILSDVCRMDVNENRYYVSKTYEAIIRGESPFDSFPYYGSSSSLVSYTLVPLLNAMIRTNRIENVFRFLDRMQKGRLRTFVQQERSARDEQKERVAEIKRLGHVFKLKGMTVSLRPQQEHNYRPFNGLYANELMGENRSGALVLEVDSSTGMVSGSFRGWQFGKDVLEEWGFECHGHDKACGASISAEGFRNFIENFEYEGEIEIDYVAKIGVNQLTEEDWLWFAHFNEYAGNGCEQIRFAIIDDPVTANTLRKRTIWHYENGLEVVDFSTDKIGKDGLIVEPTEKYEEFTLIRKVEGD